MTYDPGEWTPEAIASERAARARRLEAGYCPDSGERLSRVTVPRGELWMCPMCDCFGYCVNAETGGPME
jgi:hypothetical protein